MKYDMFEQAKAGFCSIQVVTGLTQREQCPDLGLGTGSGLGTGLGKRPSLNVLAPSLFGV